MSSLTQTDNFHDLQTPRLINQTKQLSFLFTSQTQPVNTNIQAGPQNLEPQNPVQQDQVQEDLWQDQKAAL